MRINRKDKLFGHPILKIRAVVRLAMEHLYWEDRQSADAHISRILGCPDSEASEVLDRMIEQRYVFLNNRDGLIFINETQKGRRLGVTRANPPITREKANRLLVDLLKRVIRVNADPQFLYAVKSVKVFGSYLSDAAILGDLDVAIELIKRLPRILEQRKEENKRILMARRAGRRFRNISDEVGWPREEVKRELRTKQKGLSLHFDDSIMDKVIHYRVVYPRTSQALADPITAFSQKEIYGTQSLGC